MRPLPIFAAIFTGSALMSIDSAILGSAGASFWSGVISSVSAYAIARLILEYSLFKETARGLDLDERSGRRTTAEAQAELRRVAKEMGYNLK
jgi:hypothetical protein